MAINPSIGLIGVAKQSAKGTAASTPTFVHGLTGGQTFKLDRSVAEDAVACGVRTGIDSHVESVVPGVDFDSYAYSDVFALYMLAALGNITTVANSGTGASSHKHTITMGNALPWLTFFGNIGGQVTEVSDSKVDQLELSFEGNKPLELGITAVGMAALFGLSAIPGSVTPSCFDGYFTCTGGTFKIETLGDSPAVVSITKGSLSINNNCNTDPLIGMVTPGDIAEGQCVVSGSVTTKPDDIALYRKMVTGSASGTTPTGLMVYGSFELNFTHTKETSHKLKITATHVPFTADFPSVDPNGTAAEIDFGFDAIGVTSASGSPITVVVENDTSSY